MFLNLNLKLVKKSNLLFMKITIVIIFLLFFTGLSFAQGTVDYQTQQTYDLFKRREFLSKTGNNLDLSQIEGSPYLNDEFENGTIYTTEKQQYVDVPLRYNIYNEQLEFKSPQGIIQALATPEILELAKFGDTQIAYQPYISGNKTKNGFFIVLSTGKASLYSKPEIAFKEATEPAAYKEAEPPKFLRKSDEYYLRFDSTPAKRIGNKKDLIAAFPDKQSEIKSYISKNKIKAGKAESLKKLVEYYNSL